MEYFTMDVKAFEEMTEAIKRFSDGKEAESIINEYLRGDGAELMESSIRSLIPASGRKWKGKKTAASATNPFRRDFENLSVTIATKPGYHYLYFPDDGSNTVHHRGNQQFMLHGMETRTEQVGNEIIQKLLERLEE